jgi:hypothetical protein
MASSAQEAGEVAAHGRMVAAALGAGKAVRHAAQEPAMARIVTHAYRYKRPPRREKAVPLAVPAVVRAADPAKARKRATTVRQSDEVTTESPPANDDRKQAETSAQRASRSVIAAIRRRSRFGDAPDLTPEECQRRRDAADAMFQNFKRQLVQRRQDGGG